MNVFLVTLVALIRRCATLAGSALLTFAIQSWEGWVHGAFLANPKTAALWPVFYLIIEGIQKAWRAENAKKAEAVAVAAAITPPQV